jgi:hypothetical protein
VSNAQYARAQEKSSEDSLFGLSRISKTVSAHTAQHTKGFTGRKPTRLDGSVHLRHFVTPPPAEATQVDRDSALLFFKRKNSTLNYFCYHAHLIHVHVCTAQTVNLLPIISCMFFWPEEYALASKSVDDAFIFEFNKIDIRYEDNRIAPFFFRAAVQIAVDL